MHCNLKPSEPRQPFPRFKYDAEFEVAEPIHCHTIAILLIHYYTL